MVRGSRCECPCSGRCCVIGIRVIGRSTPQCAEPCKGFATSRRWDVGRGSSADAAWRWRQAPERMHARYREKCRSHDAGSQDLIGRMGPSSPCLHPSTSDPEQASAARDVPLDELHRRFALRNAGSLTLMSGASPAPPAAYMAPIDCSQESSACLHAHLSVSRTPRTTEGALACFGVLSAGIYVSNL